MIEQALLASMVGATLWLDRFQVLQIMVSRPVVAAPLVGFVLGNTTAGVATAILFELLWLAKPPLGGYIPPDATLGSVATTAVVVLVQPDTGACTNCLVFLTFIILLPLSFVGVLADRFHRRLLGALARSAERRQFKTNQPVGSRNLAIALFTGFACSFALLFPVIVGGYYVARKVWLFVPPSGEKILECAYYVVPVIGVAEMMTSRQTKTHRVLFLVGIAIAVGAGICWRVFFTKT